MGANGSMKEEPTITTDELMAEWERLAQEQPPTALSKRDKKRLRQRLQQGGSEWGDVVEEARKRKDEELEDAKNFRKHK